MATPDTTNGKSVTVLVRTGNLVAEANFFMSDSEVVGDDVLLNINIDSANQVMTELA